MDQSSLAVHLHLHIARTEQSRFENKFFHPQLIIHDVEKNIYSK